MQRGAKLGITEPWHLLQWQKYWRGEKSWDVVGFCCDSAVLQETNPCNNPRSSKPGSKVLVLQKLSHFLDSVIRERPGLTPNAEDVAMHPTFSLSMRVLCSRVL